MRRVYRILLALGALIAAVPASAQLPASDPVDYSKPASWLCRPGQEEICTAGLDAMGVDGDGTRTPQPFKAAADAPIDCFYVYPTVSREPTHDADMIATDDVKHVAWAQAGRLAAKCRLFVPIYRQVTLAGMNADLKAGGAVKFGPAYGDVLAAWRSYLAHDNHGRGVVLVGHSQGTMLLQRLIAEEIDGKPDQAKLVAAFLAGDPGLAVPAGATVGGAFKHVPLCAAAAETGCAYVWGSYLDSDASAVRVFGHSPGGGMVAACDNPAAPGGGTGALKLYMPKPSLAPANDPPWIEVTGQLSGACTADAQGDVFRVSVLPSRYAALLSGLLQSEASGAGWGLHRLDVNLVEGNMLDVIDAEARSWAARTP